MNDFSYVVAASILHDPGEVEAVFSAFEPLFSSMGGRRIDLGHLPAALEIATWAKQKGGSAIAVQLSSPDDASARAEIFEAISLTRALAEMRSSRIGTAGEPSDWLVASSQNSAAVSSSWGAEIEQVAFGELLGRIETIRKEDAVAPGGKTAVPGDKAAATSDEAAAFLHDAGFRREASAGEDGGPARLLLAHCTVPRSLLSGWDSASGAGGRGAIFRWRRWKLSRRRNRRRGAAFPRIRR